MAQINIIYRKIVLIHLLTEENGKLVMVSAFSRSLMYAVNA